MAGSSGKIEVYQETGQKRTFAGTLDWPGWCRSGWDEGSAVQALFECGPRYARALRNARTGFESPATVSELGVIERLEGNATTDFGAPTVALAADSRPVDDHEVRRFHTLLRACWRAFDAAA